MPSRLGFLLGAALGLGVPAFAADDLMKSAQALFKPIPASPPFATLTVPSGTDPAKEPELLDRAEHGCLISNSLRGTRVLEAQVISADPASVAGDHAPPVRQTAVVLPSPNPTALVRRPPLFRRIPQSLKPRRYAGTDA